MSTQKMNVLETSRMSSRLITLAAALLVLLVFGIGATIAQVVQPQVDGGIDPDNPGSCAASVLPHFPLQGGNEWNYVKKGPGGEDPWQVSVVTRTTDAASALQGYFGATRTVCAGVGGVVHEVTADAGDEMWYDLGGAVGSVWRLRLDPGTGDAPDCIDGSKVTISSRSEHVEVAAGSFDNVIRVDYVSPCFDAGIMAEWFAPGVGLIKRIEQSFAGPVTSELETAKIGGLLLPAPSVTTSLAVDKALYSIPVSIAPSEDSAPSLTANLVLSNGSATPGRYTFVGCPSMTVSLIDQFGKAVVTAHANDGTECKAGKVTIEVTDTPLALPISIPLVNKAWRLDAGRYLVVATLDTLDAAPLRPFASSTIDIEYVSAGAR
jgi:hypothetical protein